MPAPTSTSALPDGTSALVLAVINAHYELAALLLDKGADPNADAQGWTALHQIAWSRRHNTGFNLPGPVPTGGLDSLELVRRLVRKGANVNARADERAARRQSQHAEPHRRDAVSDGRQVRRRAADERAARARAPTPSIKTELGTTALMAAAGVGIWAPGENPGTHEEALAAVKVALEAGGGERQRRRQQRRDGAARRRLSRRRDSGHSVPADKGARLDVRNKKGMDAGERGRRRGVHAGGAEALSRSGGAAAPPMRERGMPVPTGAARRRAGTCRRRCRRRRRRHSCQHRDRADGVFTEAQAARGQVHYRSSCAPLPQRRSAGRQRRAGAGRRRVHSLAGAGRPWTIWCRRSSGRCRRRRRTRSGMPPTSDIVSYLLKSERRPGGRRASCRWTR